MKMDFQEKAFDASLSKSLGIQRSLFVFLHLPLCLIESRDEILLKGEGIVSTLKRKSPHGFNKDPQSRQCSYKYSKISKIPVK